MANTLSRDELLVLFNERQRDFVGSFGKRIKSEGLGLNLRCEAELGVDGKYHIANNSALIEAVSNLAVKVAIEAIFAFIDSISSPESMPLTTTGELQNLKQRVARLEKELLLRMPMDFEGPSSENPQSN